MTSAKQSSSNLIFDTLNCATVSREQMERTREGGVAALNLTIIRPWDNFEKSMAYLGRVFDRLAEMDDLVTIALSTADISKAHAEGRIAIVMGTQNSTLVEGDLALLSVMHRLGFRILQPTYNEPNLFGDGATVAEDRGLSDLGHQWVQEMNRLGMVIDLSHSGLRTSTDIIAASQQPVIISHANAFARCNSPRNKPDSLIRAVADTGGVTGAVCWAPALKHATRPTIDDYIDMVEYMINVAGVEHVTFASDLAEGVYPSEEAWEAEFGKNGKYPSVTGMLGDWYKFHTRTPIGFESLSKTSGIWDRFLARGHSTTTVEKIMGGNLLRVCREIWGS